VVAAGLLDEVLTEQNLSRTFGMPLVLQHAAGRWSARRRLRRTSALGMD
jgi:iron complex transport system ATP-binding protein